MPVKYALESAMPKRKASGNAKRFTVGHTTELDVTSLPSLQSDIVHTYLEQIKTNTLLPSKDGSVLEFNVPASTYYTSLFHTYFFLSFRVKTTAGNLANDAKISIINLPALTVFRDVELALNDTIVTRFNNTYSYASYLQCLLFVPEELKKYRLKSLGYARDTAELFDNIDAQPNPGPFFDRNRFIASSEEAQFTGRLLLDFCSVDRILPKHTSIGLRFFPATADFVVQGKKKVKVGEADVEQKYILEFTAFSLFLQRIQLAEGISRDLDRLKAFYFPVVQYTTHVHTLPAGSQNADFLICSGILPKRVFVFQISQKRMNGDCELNSLEMKPFGITHFHLDKNGNKLPAPNGLDMNVAPSAQSIMESYMLGLWKPLEGYAKSVGITPDEWVSSYFVVAVDLTQDLAAGHATLHKQQTGTLRLNITYSAQTTEALCIFSCSEYDALLQIGSDKTVQYVPLPVE